MSLRACGRCSRPPRRSREVFDRARTAASTSSAARSATRSSATSTSTRSTSTHDRRAPRRDPARSSGRVADQVWEQGRAFGTIGAPRRGADLRGHDPPRRGLPAGLAQARGHLRRRRRGRPVAPRLHDQRHGAGPRVPAAHRPLRGRGGPRPAPARHPARPRGLLRRRPAADAARREVPRALRPRRRRGARRPRRASSHRGSRSSRPSASATSSTRSLLVEVPSVALWFVVRTGLADPVPPRARGARARAGPVHRHKDVLAHTLAVVDKTSPDRLLRLAALFHDVGKPKTRAIGPDGVSFHHHEVVGRADDEVAHGAAALPDRGRSTPWRGSSSCTCGSTPTRWAGRTGPCAATCATPGEHLARLNELTRCDCTTRNARRAARARRADGRARGPHRRAARARGARRDAPRARRGRGHGAARHPTGPRRWARRSRSCSTCGSTRASSAPKRPAAASTSGGARRAALAARLVTAVDVHARRLTPRSLFCVVYCSILRRGAAMSVRHALLALLSEGPKYGLQLRNEFEAKTGDVWPLNVGPGVHDAPAPGARRARRLATTRARPGPRRTSASPRPASASSRRGCAPRRTSPPRPATRS